MFGKNVSHLIQLEKERSENQYKSALLRTVSHELRTPINAVLSMTELVKNSENVSNENQERLEIISASCNYQLCLINDLLDYAQIIAGCLKISKIPMNLNDLLCECLALIKFQIREQDVHLELKTFNLPEIIVSDPYRLKQILLNLLSNAKKFTRKGFIELEARCINKQLKINCKDTGIGIPSDKIAILFTQFGRIEENFSINQQGVGLGLVISNMLVKELGGNGITVTSEAGMGSCFSFNIEIKEIPTSLMEIPEENTKISIPSIFTKSLLHKVEILIVDDTYFNVLALMQILKSEGITSCYSVNGEDALLKIKKKNFDCILMDCEMPILNGWETTKKIHKLKAKKKLKKVPPIIGFTAHTSEDIKTKCFDSGMDDLIIKPCPKETMMAKIRYWLEKKTN